MRAEHMQGVILVIDTEISLRAPPCHLQSNPRNSLPILTVNLTSLKRLPNWLILLYFTSLKRSPNWIMKQLFAEGELNIAEYLPRRS